MANLQVKAAKLLLHNVLRHFRHNGTVLAEAVSPVVCPEPAKPLTEIDEIDIDS